MQVFTLKRIDYGWALLASQMVALPTTSAIYIAGVVLKLPFAADSHLIKISLFLLALYIMTSALVLTLLVWIVAIVNWFLGSKLNGGILGVSARYDVEECPSTTPEWSRSLLGMPFLIFLLPLILMILLIPIFWFVNWLLKAA
jgi:hypothetical protein